MLIDSKPSLEKLELISSWINTLLVLHLVKSVKLLFWKVRNLDFELFAAVSKSLTKSKLLIASTLCLSLSSNTLATSNTTNWFESKVFPDPTLIFLTIEVSEKFLSPAGCTNLLIGFTNLSHSTVLFTV